MLISWVMVHYTSATKLNFCWGTVLSLSCFLFFCFFKRYSLSLASSYYSYIYSSRRQIRIDTLSKGAVLGLVRYEEILFHYFKGLVLNSIKHTVTHMYL